MPKREDWVWASLAIGCIVMFATGFGMVPYDAGIEGGWVEAIEESMDNPERFKARQEVIKAQRELISNLKVEAQ